MPIISAIIGWFTAHAARLAIIGALSMLLGVGVYMKGQQSSAVKCASAQADIIVKEVGKHNEIHEKVEKMSCADVDAALDSMLRSGS